MLTKCIKATIALLAACASTASGAAPSLREAFAEHFYVGAAIGRQLFQPDRAPTRQLAARQFNSTTAVNEMKWQRLTPEPGEYDFRDADNLVQFGLENDMYIVGHVFFWHNQVPDWVFQDDDGELVSREVLLDRMRSHVRQLVQRYGNRVDAWDVVNEAFTDDGSLRRTNWTRILGDDFVEQAFRIAGEEVPPDVELIYNDYSLTRPAKRDAVVRMVKHLQSEGIRIDGVGMQGHWARTGPSIAAIERSIRAFAATGVHVHISELDIDMLPRHPEMWAGNADVMLRLQEDPALDPYTEGLTPKAQRELAARYESIFRLFVQHSDVIRRVTFWGVNDADSWLNNWPIRGRTSHPLLFDRDDNPKPAFHAVTKVPSASAD